MKAQKKKKQVSLHADNSTTKARPADLSTGLCSPYTAYLCLCLPRLCALLRRSRSPSKKAKALGLLRAHSQRRSARCEGDAAKAHGPKRITFAASRPFSALPEDIYKRICVPCYNARQAQKQPDRARSKSDGSPDIEVSRDITSSADVDPATW